MRGRVLATLFVALTACGPSGAGSSADTSASETSTSATGDTEPASSVTSATGVEVTGSSTRTSTGATATDTTTASTTTGPVCVPVCDYMTDCNDGEDNDGDGSIDTEDLDCATPCHDGEEDAYHGLPIGGGDCKEDCYFDDDVGSGNDGCIFDMRCDPLGPKAWFTGCDPIPQSPNCENQPTMQQPDCLATCLPMVPPGCDCFGCCTFDTPRGPEDRWLGDPACTVGDPTTCPACTQNEGCVNLCDDPCEWCFGQPRPPTDCEAITCEHGPPCTADCDCEPQSACLQGCCRPVSLP